MTRRRRVSLVLLGESPLLGAPNVPVHRFGSSRSIPAFEGLEDLRVLGNSQAHVIRPMTGGLPQPVRMGTCHLGHLLKEAVTAVAQDGLVKIPVRLKIAAVLPQPGLAVSVAKPLRRALVLIMRLTELSHQFMMGRRRPCRRRHLDDESGIEQLPHLLDAEWGCYAIALERGATDQPRVFELNESFPDRGGRNFETAGKGVDAEWSTGFEFTGQQHLEQDVIDPVTECPAGQR